MSGLLAPENTAFAVALALLGLLVLVQAIGLGHLFPNPDLDLDAPDGGVDIGGGLASLFGFGKIPFIVWLSCLLACFGLLGLSIQHLVTGIFGGPFPVAAASGAALMAAIPANSVLTNLLARIWPHDETTAVPVEALLGKRATIAVGKASRGNPARATVRDQFGQLHNVMVEPHEDGISFGEGKEVLLARREGEIFFALDGEGPIRLID